MRTTFLIYLYVYTIATILDASLTVYAIAYRRDVSDISPIVNAMQEFVKTNPVSALILLILQPVVLYTVMLFLLDYVMNRYVAKQRIVNALHCVALLPLIVRVGAIINNIIVLTT